MNSVTDEAIERLPAHEHGGARLGSSDLMDIIDRQILRVTRPFIANTHHTVLCHLACLPETLAKTLSDLHPATTFLAFVVVCRLKIDDARLSWSYVDLAGHASFFDPATGLELLPGSLLVVMELRRGASAFTLTDMAITSYAVQHPNGTSMAGRYASAFMDRFRCANTLHEIVKGIPDEVEYDASARHRISETDSDGAVLLAFRSLVATLASYRCSGYDSLSSAAAKLAQSGQVFDVQGSLVWLADFIGGSCDVRQESGQ